MNCSDVRKSLDFVSDGADNELSAEIRNHLETCPDCRKWYSETRMLIKILQKAQSELPAPDIAGMMMSQLPERHPVSISTKPLVRRFLPIAGLSWLVGLSVLIVMIKMFFMWWQAGNGAELIKLWSFIHTSFSSSWFNDLILAFKEIASASAHVVRSLGKELVRGFVLFICLDSIFIYGLYLMWIRRSRIRNSANWRQAS